LETKTILVFLVGILIPLPFKAAGLGLWLLQWSEHNQIASEVQTLSFSFQHYSSSQRLEAVL
jgi:hypothetical protein